MEWPLLGLNNKVQPSTCHVPRREKHDGDYLIMEVEMRVLHMTKFSHTTDAHVESNCHCLHYVS